MKIIALLNKIANGEEVPKKIKLRAFELKRTQSSNFHRLYVDDDGMFFPKDYDFTLNDEVEIIEKPKNIKKLDENNTKVLTNIIENRKKINEIIDYLDYLKGKGDE